MFSESDLCRVVRSVGRIQGITEMLPVFGHLQARLRRRSRERVDSVVSSLHHRATSLLLMACCGLITVRQYFGQPVQCILDASGDAIPEHVLNTYCFVTSTYTVVGKTGGYPTAGVGPDYNRPIKKHAYYQWVPLVLFLQSAFFATPHATWKWWEGGLVKGSVNGISRCSSLLLTHSERRQHVKRLARYFVRRLHSHRIWAGGFIVCEFMNLLNVLGNVWLTDTLLGGTFYQYGLEVISFLKAYPEDSRYEKIDAIFPKVTKCTFYKYGPTGTIQNHDALCVMSLNVVNEKIYTALWFWFIILTVITILGLIYRIMQICILLCVHEKVGPHFQRTMGLPPIIPRRVFVIVSRQCDLADWLYFHLLATNMELTVYREFVYQLVTLLQDTSNNTSHDS